MEKKWYTMYLSAEEQACGNVLLTEKEAKIVKNAIEQMYENISGGGWCGSVGIDIEHPRTDKYDYGSNDEENEKLTDEEFVAELRKILPNDPSETEIEIALKNFHSGMEMDSIVNHLIWGE